MKKPAIPSVPKPGQDRFRFDTAVKERLEMIGGDRMGKIEPLPATATLADVIAAVNAMIEATQ